MLYDKKYVCSRYTVCTIIDNDYFTFTEYLLKSDSK